MKIHKNLTQIQTFKYVEDHEVLGMVDSRYLSIAEDRSTKNRKFAKLQELLTLLGIRNNSLRFAV